MGQTAGDLPKQLRKSTIMSFLRYSESLSLLLGLKNSVYMTDRKVDEENILVRVIFFRQQLILIPTHSHALAVMYVGYISNEAQQCAG